jgi:hypothetical protein
VKNPTQRSILLNDGGEFFLLLKENFYPQAKIIVLTSVNLPDRICSLRALFNFVGNK